MFHGGAEENEKIHEQGKESIDIVNVDEFKHHDYEEMTWFLNKFFSLQEPIIKQRKKKWRYTLSIKLVIRICVCLLLK